MHLLTEKTVHIQKPAHMVFGYVTNLETFADWFPGVIAIASANPLPHGAPGKEYRETVAVPLRGTRRITLRVCEGQGGDLSFATESSFAPLLPRMEIALKEAGAGACELTWRMFSRNNSTLMRYTLLPLARRVMAKRAALGVAALKKQLE